MTFSEFAKVLSTYCNDKTKNGDYIVSLVDNIMGGQPGRAHKDGTYQNPLRGKEEDTIMRRYIDGSRSIPANVARIIYGSLNKEKFAKYISTQCHTIDSIEKLYSDLVAKEKESKQKCKKVDFNNKEIGELCTNIFEDILHELAT